MILSLDLELPQIFTFYWYCMGNIIGNIRSHFESKNDPLNAKDRPARSWCFFEIDLCETCKIILSHGEFEVGTIQKDR